MVRPPEAGHQHPSTHCDLLNKQVWSRDWLNANDSQQWDTAERLITTSFQGVQWDTNPNQHSPKARESEMDARGAPQQRRGAQQKQDMLCGRKGRAGEELWPLMTHFSSCLWPSLCHLSFLPPQRCEGFSSSLWSWEPYSSLLILSNNFLFTLKFNQSFICSY